MTSMTGTSSQDKILYQIKRLGPRTARELGQLLGVTTMGIRQHLAQMEQEHLVEPGPEESVGRGRPVKRWKLTREGHGRFPDAHAQITRDVIISVKNLLGDAAMDRVIEQRTRDTLAHYTSGMKPGMPLENRVRRLCEMRTHEGYMAEYEQLEDGSYVLIEHHCPICIAAEACQGFCRSELDVFQAVFEGCATVTRVDHLLHGARRCSYRIQP